MFNFTKPHISSKYPELTLYMTTTVKIVNDFLLEKISDHLYGKRIIIELWGYAYMSRITLYLEIKFDIQFSFIFIPFLDYSSIHEIVPHPKYEF